MKYIMDITLHEFTISHYSEKVRWALDFKRLRYKSEKHIPGLHLPVAYYLTGKSYLPILLINGKVYSDSTAIMQELDNLFPENTLFPDNDALREEAMDLVHYADEEIGKHARRVTYSEILDHAQFMKDVLSTGLEGVSKMSVQFMAPLLTEGIRRRYSVYEPEISESRRRLSLALDQIKDTLGARRFLCGNSLTAADITVASLLFPIIFPAKFPYELPQNLPPSVNAFHQKYKSHPVIKWADSIYRDYRYFK